MIGKQIELDRSASKHELRQRDHAIGLLCDASDDVGRLLFWLKNMPDLVNPAEDARTGWYSEIFTASVMRSLALVLGFMGMLLALPVAASVGVLTRFAVAQYRQSPIYLGDDHEDDDPGDDPGESPPEAEGASAT